MSFEGFRQILCDRGHLSEHDVYEAEPQACEAVYVRDGKETCGEAFVWRNTVDETNGLNEHGIYETEVVLGVLYEPVVAECPHCKQEQLLEDTRYKFPEVGVGKYERR